MPSILWLVLLVILIVMLLPSWPYAGWGWYPSGGLGVILLILLILLLFGRR